MTQWSSLPLSWIGRIKMAILPKLLYLFRVLPIPVPAYYLLCLLFCKNGQQCLSGTHWSPEYLKTYFTFPNFAEASASSTLRCTTKAAHLASLPKCHATHEIPLWVAIKSVECGPLSVSNLMWLRPVDRSNLCNPGTRYFISLWNKLKSNYNLQPPTTPCFHSSRTQPSTRFGSLQQHSIDEHLQDY